MLSRSTRALALIAAASGCLAFASAAQAEPGASGLGDPYFPLEGNGGYDAKHYDLALAYDPASDRLDGVATITAKATQDLSSFDLDLQQLDVSEVTVDNQPAQFLFAKREVCVIDWVCSLNFLQHIDEIFGAYLHVGSICETQPA